MTACKENPPPPNTNHWLDFVILKAKIITVIIALFKKEQKNKVKTPRNTYFNSAIFGREWVSQERPGTKDEREKSNARPHEKKGVDLARVTWDCYAPHTHYKCTPEGYY